jgi:phospholipase C
MGDVDHVVVVMLENRSFDHLLGLLSDEQDYPGVRLGDPLFSNPLDPTDPASERIGVTDDATFGIGLDPPHSHASVLEQLGRRRRTRGHRWLGVPAMDGFVAAYSRKIAGQELGRPVVHWERILGVAAVLFAGLVMVAALRWSAPLLLGAAAVLAAVELLVLWAYRRRRALPVHAFGPVFAWPVAAASGIVLVVAPLTAVTGYWQRFGVLAVPVLAVVLAVVLRIRARVHAAPPTDPELARNVMRCLRPDQLPVLATLARAFTVCTRWHCSVPGATWPNRNFVHAGTSDGTVDIEVGFYRNATVFERLSEADASWHIYRDGMAQAMVFEKLLEEPHIRNWYEIGDFARHVAAGTLPRYSFIEPCHDGPRSNSQHPGNNDFDAPPGWRTDFERGERLVASIYQTLLAHRAVFDRTMLVITYDEHGGLYDHVPPPTRFTAPAGTLDGHPPGSPLPRILGWFVEQPASRFRFRLLGPRVPALVVSPLVPAGRDDTLYDHTAIPATVRRLFAPGTAELSRREGRSATLEHLCSLPEPRGDLPDLADLLNPRPAGQPAPAGTGDRDDDFARQLRTLATQVVRKLVPRTPAEPAATDRPAALPDAAAPDAALTDAALADAMPPDAALADAPSPDAASPGTGLPDAASRVVSAAARAARQEADLG